MQQTQGRIAGHYTFKQGDAHHAYVPLSAWAVKEFWMKHATRCVAKRLRFEVNRRKAKFENKRLLSPLTRETESPRTSSGSRTTGVAPRHHRKSVQIGRPYRRLVGTFPHWFPQ